MHTKNQGNKKFRISMKHITYKPTAKHQEVCIKRQMQELALRRWKERCKVTLNSIAMEIWQKKHEIQRQQTERDRTTSQRDRT